MTTWSSEVCETNGISIHYLRTGGAKPPVVLLHGLRGSGARWTPLARALEGEFDVVMPDSRGHGDSSAPPHGVGSAAGCAASPRSHLPTAREGSGSDASAGQHPKG
jgi:pimeloyl-ACP methyl ester carboxylesterase